MSELQGFQSPKHQYIIQSQNILPSKRKIEPAKTILKQMHHSLQPDMINGWKPKLPSCPLPLTYHNFYNELLLQHIPKDDRFKIVFLGKRWTNSVQVNQQYDYSWKYRQRYSLNLAIVQQAIKGAGNTRTEIQSQVKESLNNKELLFDSNFQSGNLEMAVKVKPHEYDLFLRSDTNTKGHTNWYYFKVNNQEFTGIAQINVCNLGKTKTLYNKGMRPYVCEVNQEDQKSQAKWTQQKTLDVCFVERYCRYGFEKKTYQLQFKYNFKKPNTQVYFAYGIPYTYSQLENFITEISDTNKDIVKVEKLCESVGGLNLPLLVISDKGFFCKTESQTNSLHSSKSFSTSHDHSSSVNRQTNEDVTLQKKAILITGRIHPGQSNASYVLQGLIRQLLQNDEIHQKMRQHYVFYIIPMLNPDGVVAGNFRTSYSGKDLNRQFNKLNKCIYPEIFALNQLATSLKEKYKKRLEFYFDFHGHSSKKNLFCYGPEHIPSNLMFFKSRTFAKIIEEINPIFSYRKSIFQVSEHKKTTARAHMLWNIKIPMTYTFEISNGLYETKQQKSIRLCKESMLEAGKAVYQGLCRYVSLETRNFHCHKAKAKVDSGIRSRKMSSQRSVRQRSFKVQIINPTKSTNQQSRQLSVQKQFFRSKQVQNHHSWSFHANEFSRYINQIKKESESMINSDPQGGSDSEGSQEDLSSQELNKLHVFLQSRTDLSKKDTRDRFYNFKIKSLKPIRQRKFSAGQENKENSKNLDNVEKKPREKNGIQTSRRLYQLSQKMVPIKKPPLPLVVVNTKFVLCQKNFTVDFDASKKK